MNRRKELRKLPQNELRRLMIEHKAKSIQSVAPSLIQSPLAKYDDTGKLSCIICRTPVRSNNAWKVHVNSRQHKANIEAAKELQADLLKHHIKPQKQENSNMVTELPVVHCEKVFKASDSVENSSTKQQSILPENFFDIQMCQHDSKDPIEEEWKKFQKEIKEESVASTAIIADEQDAATTDRQIQEINEQIFLWSKVVSLETKKNCLRQSHLNNTNAKKKEESGDESDTFEEFPDWRLKNFLK